MLLPASSYNKSQRLQHSQGMLDAANRSQGFTLVEMMVVIVIMGIFAGMITLSVGSTDARKNRAFYEHLLDSLEYVRLVSAERMQPMGLVLQADKQGQVKPVIMSLQNPYAHFEATANSAGDNAKNSMELSAMTTQDAQMPKPHWAVVADLELPELPTDVDITITPVASSVSSSSSFATQQQPLQPWFVGTEVPEVLWFGTGEAAPARIEIRYNQRLVGDAILLLPDGRVMVDK